MLVPEFRKADCHSHTTFSDGTFTVKELLDLAKLRGLYGLSITDHDSIQAYSTAIPYAKQLEISLISGIEISAEQGKHSIHVLGYSFALHHPELVHFCQTLQDARYQRNEAILDKLAKFNIKISLQEIADIFPNRTLGRPHIAFVMVKKGFVNSIKQAFQFYLGDNKKAYVGGFQVSVEKAVALIHRAGGMAILAHPEYLSPSILPELYEMPFDGIEAYYGNLSSSQVQGWVEVAKAKNWFVTGGSDFHGQKKGFPLGCAFTPPENFLFLENLFHSHITPGGSEMPIELPRNLP